MFAPRPEVVASELLRVCRSGGLIAMANWTPQGFVGKTFQLTAKMAPPPPRKFPHPFSGETRKRCDSAPRGRGVSRSEYGAATNVVRLSFSSAAKSWFFSGNTSVQHKPAFKRLDPNGQAALVSALETLWKEHNRAGRDQTSVEVEYLDVRCHRASSPEPALLLAVAIPAGFSRRFYGRKRRVTIAATGVPATNPAHSSRGHAGEHCGASHSSASVWGGATQNPTAICTLSSRWSRSQRLG